MITNKLGLPETFVNFAKSDYEYKPKEYRVTSLLKGLKETILEQRHRKEVDQDVSDMIWLIFGTAVHKVLEESQEGNAELKEERMRIKVGDYTLSGQFDLYNADTHTITDYKTASVWKIISKDFKEWKMQTSIYAYMLEDMGFKVDHTEIIAMLKDHSKAKAKHDLSYPQLPVERIYFDLGISYKDTVKNFLEAKFESIRQAEQMADDDIPPCTPEERYNDGDKYAVMKKGNKKATRVVSTKQEAEDYIKWAVENKGLKEKDLSIELRKGEDKKCKDYCSVCKFCNYYKEHVAEEN